MLKELKEGTNEIPGVFIEDNSFCISVHYRHVLKDVSFNFPFFCCLCILYTEIVYELFQDYPALENKVRLVLRQHSGFHLTKGKKVLELRPSIKWNKGNALLYLLDTLGFSGSTHVLPIYIGDDKTDEDAFKV